MLLLLLLLMMIATVCLYITLANTRGHCSVNLRVNTIIITSKKEASGSMSLIFTYLSIYVIFLCHPYLSTYPSLYLSICLSIHLATLMYILWESISLTIYLINLCIDPSIFLSHLFSCQQSLFIERCLYSYSVYVHSTVSYTTLQYVRTYVQNRPSPG